MAAITSQVTVGSTLILTTASDPSASAGTTAPIGSLALVTDGSNPFFKTGAAATAWTSLNLLTSVIAPQYGGTGVANNSASTITISGNFATTITVSATTAVTLPTSGTLYGTKTGSITSAQLFTSLTNPTGNTSSAVFADSPTFVTKITSPEVDVSGTGGAGFINFVAQSSNASAPSAAGFNLFAGSTGSLNWARKNGTDTFVRTFDATLTANRTYTLQDASSTMAMYSNNLSVFASTTSAQFAGVISDATGTSKVVLSDSPAFTTQIQTPSINGASGSLAFTNTATATGTLINFLFTNAAHTNQTLSTNTPNFKVAGTTKQWATGALALQYWNYFTTSTPSFVGASTLAESVGMYVEGATSGGANTTITNNFIYGGTVDSNTFRLGSLTGSTTTLAMYGNVTTPSSTNYFLMVNSSANATLNGASAVVLAIANSGKLTLSSTVASWGDAVNFTLGTTNGTKFGTATTQKLSFWNAATIVQPTTAIAASTFVANTSGTLNDSATWDSYTIGQVVKALRNVGLLA
jgi:hypothetical protein